MTNTYLVNESLVKKNFATVSCLLWLPGSSEPKWWQLFRPGDLETPEVFQPSPHPTPTTMGLGFHVTHSFLLSDFVMRVLILPCNVCTSLSHHSMPRSPASLRGLHLMAHTPVLTCDPCPSPHTCLLHLSQVFTGMSLVQGNHYPNSPLLWSFPSPCICHRLSTLSLVSLCIAGLHSLNISSTRGEGVFATEPAGPMCPAHSITQ